MIGREDHAKTGVIDPRGGVGLLRFGELGQGGVVLQEPCAVQQLFAVVLRLVRILFCIALLEDELSALVEAILAESADGQGLFGVEGFVGLGDELQQEVVFVLEVDVGVFGVFILVDKGQLCALGREAFGAEFAGGDLIFVG